MATESDDLKYAFGEIRRRISDPRAWIPAKDHLIQTESGAFVEVTDCCKKDHHVRWSLWGALDCATVVLDSRIYDSIYNLFPEAFKRTCGELYTDHTLMMEELDWMEKELTK